MIILQDCAIQAREPLSLAAVLQQWLVTLNTADQRKEHFLTLLLDARNNVKLIDVVSVGTLNTSLVHPREVFIRAIIEAAASLIVAHNHPSGDCLPSDADIEITRRLQEAGKLIGIQLLDHLIISPSLYYSFSEGHLI